MSKYEYIIVGDTAEFEGCLVRLCGTSYERALEVLEEVKRDGFKGFSEHSNFRIEKVKSEDCWWNDPVLCN